MSTTKDLHLDPAALEEGRANGNGVAKSGHHHHHHHPHLKGNKRLQQMRAQRRRKREAERIQAKLPGLMQTDDVKDLGKLRKRLLIKNEIVAAVAEFIGTFLFLFFAFGIATQAGQQQLTETSNGQSQSAGTLDTNQLLYSSLGFGFALAVNAWVFFRVSGGLFNPAVTLGLYLCGALTWYRAIILTVVQFVSAIAAAGMSQVIIPGGTNARTKLGGNTSLAQGFFIEMFCTAMLMFAIYMLAGEKHKATFLAPVGIGLALFLCELFATGLTGGSLNPARTLGPDVIAAEFETSTWIYYTAPFVGSMVAAFVYWVLKASRYETANEGQDDAETQEALVLRDTHGNVTGAVQRVDLANAPHIPGITTGVQGAGNQSVTSLIPDSSVVTPHGAVPGPDSRPPSVIVSPADNLSSGLTPAVTPGAEKETYYTPGTEEKELSEDAAVAAEAEQQLQEKEKAGESGLAAKDFS